VKLGNGQWEAGWPESGFFALFLSFLVHFPYLCSPNVYFMLAVVKIAGQQFKVQKDQTLYVPRIAGNAGDKVEFGEVLLSHDQDKLAFGKNVKAVIKAEIIDQVQGDKVIAFKMKRRKGYRKKHGHRTHYTKIRISEIA
jgi:large subunit ribosomal protein L21